MSYDYYEWSWLFALGWERERHGGWSSDYLHVYLGFLSVHFVCSE